MARGEVLADPRLKAAQGAGAEGDTLEGHDWPSSAVVELRHTAGRRQAGRSAGRQHLFSRGGAAKGVDSYPLSEAQRGAACTWLLDEGGRHRRPSRAGAGRRVPSRGRRVPGRGRRVPSLRQTS